MQSAVKLKAINYFFLIQLGRAPSQHIRGWLKPKMTLKLMLILTKSYIIECLLCSHPSPHQYQHHHWNCIPNIWATAYSSESVFSLNFGMWPLYIPINKWSIALYCPKWLLPWYLTRSSHRIRYAVGGRVNIGHLGVWVW